MKILFITRKYPPQIGGMENFSFNLIKNMTCEKKTIILDKRQINLLWFFPYALIKALIISQKVDLVHTSDPLLSLIAFLIKKLIKKPVVTTVHGLDINYSNPLYQLYLFLFMRFDKYICVSKHTEGLLRKKGIFNTIIIPNGINPPVKNFKSLHSIKKSFGLQKDKPVILSVGRLVKRKGVYWFIENVFLKLMNSPFYLIVGEGPEKEMIKKLVVKMKLENNVKILGKIDQETLNNLYRISDIFVAPNIKVKGDTEGFGIALIEAASNGLPVVSSNLEGISDAIINKKNGFRVQPENFSGFADKINELILNKRMAKDFGKNAQEYTLKNFNWENIVRKYMFEFEKLIN